MSESPARVIFHIGQHKTGSKALQAFLAHNVDGLSQQGVYFPVAQRKRQRIKAYAISQYGFFALLRWEAIKAKGDTNAAIRFWAENRANCNPFDSLRAMFQSLQLEQSRAAAETLIISAEDLFDMHSAHEKEFSIGLVEAGSKILASLVADFNYDPLVVVYLRRQDHLLGAHYAQFIKGSSCNDLDFASFSKIFSPRLETWNILAPWVAAFGIENILIRPYEPASLPRGIVADFFQHALGLDVPDRFSPAPVDAEFVNATPDRDWIEFIRLLNRKNVEGFPTLLRQAVLQAAISEKPVSGRQAVIASWLSPKARVMLLKRHEQGNSAIAERVLLRPGKPLFSEPYPEIAAEWTEYQGLSSTTANEIFLKIRQEIVRSGFPLNGLSSRKVANILFPALSIILILLGHAIYS